MTAKIRRLFKLFRAKVAQVHASPLLIFVHVHQVLFATGFVSNDQSAKIGWFGLVIFRYNGRQASGSQSLEQQVVRLFFRRPDVGHDGSLNIDFCMDAAEMGIEAADLFESATAFITLEQGLVCFDAMHALDMSAQISILRKGHLAKFTLVRFFSGVLSKVKIEAVFLIESFRTILALKKKKGEHSKHLRFHQSE